MRLLASFLLVTVLSPVVACAQAEDDPETTESSGGWGFPAFWFDDLEEGISHRKVRSERDFARYVSSEIGACIQSDRSDCSQERKISGFQIDYAQCTRFEARGDFYQQCEGLIERVSDGTKLACVYVLGSFQAQHHRYQSTEVRMHFDADGNWILGRSPEELAELEARNREYEREAAAGTARPSLAPRYSNMHCSRNLNEFFEI